MGGGRGSGGQDSLVIANDSLKFDWWFIVLIKLLFARSLLLIVQSTSITHVQVAEGKK